MWLTIRVVATIGCHPGRELAVHGKGSSEVGSFWVLEDASTACSNQSSRLFGVSGTEDEWCGGKGPVIIGPTG